MPTIFKTPNGKWRARVVVSGVGNVTRTFPTKPMAERWHAQTYENMIGQRYFGEGYHMRFSTLVDNYIKFELPLRQSYETQYRTTNNLEPWAKALGSMLVTHIKAHHIIDFRDQLIRAHGWSNGHANHIVGQVSACLNYAVSRDIIPTNPCKKIRTLPVTVKSERILEPDEECLLLVELEKLDNPTYDTVRFALATGARRGEIAKLRWDDLDHATKSITFRSTKNGKDRTIPLSDEWFRFFITKGEHHRFQYRDYMWRKAIKAAGIDPIRFHDLRHTFVTRAIASGQNPALVAAFVGHSNQSMVAYYTHIQLNDLRQLI